MVKRIIPVLLLLAAVPLLHAENIISVDMTLLSTFARTREIIPEIPGYYTDPVLNTGWIPAVPTAVGDTFWAYGIAGDAALSFKSTGNRNVKADLALDFLLPDIAGTPAVSLKKAYIKAKFPSFKLTLGKTRIGWGDGITFNSGDVIFGSTTPYVNLTEDEIRSETDWLTSINIPLGRFSFIEGIVKAPDDMNIGNLGAGLRLYTKLAGIKIETGYFFDGTDNPAYDINHTSSNTADDISIVALHRPYLSLQGNFGPDFYLNSSLAIPAADGNNLEAVVKDTFSISLGLFHVQEVGYDNSITFRLESVILPFMNWNESAGEAGSYALLLYPDITLAIGQNVGIFVKSIISPIDLSAQFTAGFSWNIFEGFNLLSYATVNAGDGNDTFSWNKTTWIPGSDVMDGIMLMAGINYIY